MTSFKFAERIKLNEIKDIKLNENKIESKIIENPQIFNNEKELEYLSLLNEIKVLNENKNNLLNKLNELEEKSIFNQKDYYIFELNKLFFNKK